MSAICTTAQFWKRFCQTSKTQRNKRLKTRVKTTSETYNVHHTSQINGNTDTRNLFRIFSKLKQ